MAQYDDSVIVLLDYVSNMVTVLWDGEVGGEQDCFALDIKVTTPFPTNIYKGVI